MGRPSGVAERRKQLVPILARTFAELGYRRATTAELARRCKVQENILYRLWPDKKAMFIASIEHVYEQCASVWRALIAAGASGASPAERVLEHEAEHFGEAGLYRLVYAGLSETDEPDIRAALRHMYGRFHRFIREQIADYRQCGASDGQASLAAWAVVGLGSVANIGRELGLMSAKQRKALFADIGRLLLEG